MTPDGKSCVDRNECLDNPCRNGGQCINRDTAERYTCLCQSGYSGNNCELMQEEQILRLSMGALAIILLCLLSILSTGIKFISVFFLVSIILSEVDRVPNTYVSENRACSQKCPDLS